MLVIDNFMISQFKTCPRKYYNRVKMGLVNKSRPSFASTFGIAIHRGCQAHYEGKGEDGAIRAFVSEYGKFWTVWGNEEESRTPEIGSEIVAGFHQQFMDDPFKTVDGCLEVGFAVELDKDVVYCGRIDRMAMVGEDLYIVDWKTSSMPWLFCERPNDQGTGYLWSAQELKGIKVTGVIFDVIHTRPTSLKAQKEGSPKWVTDRRISGRHEWEVEEWKKTTLTFIEWIEWCERKDEWVKNAEACVRYNKICEYADLCNTEGMARELVMEQRFVVERWKPYEELEMEE